MRVLVDTCIWSVVFRYKNPVKNISDELRRLVVDDRAMIIGPIRQEILSSIKEPGKYEGLKNIFRSFIDLPMKTEIFELAADMSNQCRRKGISGSSVDFMICASARYYSLEIWSTDPDFINYDKILGLDLYKMA